ncbi:VWA domain-containing protein [Rossellomorea vietnamensis]|uniref:VWA domain-containing protein n=1 Tax=Rossellomorea vietnamensis TaxID=218284 RepID=A0ACD4CAA5_9BACI|nr:VWA domain-containing protein [Rossellomorea vietnamensis]UXH45585.1 VWA domain-containing protein [Rossellomorea vietnamensis]
MGIEFKEVLWLLLVIPLGLVLFLFVKQGMNRKERRLILALRGCAMVLLILALANPSIVLPEKAKPVIFLADRSASVSLQEDRILDEINRGVHSKHERDRYGIVSFGENAAIEQTISDERENPEQLVGEIKEGNTNLQEGLEYSSNLLPRGGRIIAMTDGKETMGAGEDLIPLLKGKKIEVEWMAIASDTKDDVAITDVSAPSVQYEGEETTLTVNTYSTTKKEIEMRITLNDQVIIKENLQVQEGNNEFQFKHVVDQSGLLVYKAEVFSKGDGSPENNALYHLARSEGAAKVMLVENADGESALAPLLNSAGFTVDVYKPEQLPGKLTSYLQYQSILFDNVAATSIPQEKMLLMEKSVKEFGRGFIMFGGSDSFALGGYFKTPIERILPVDMDVKGKKELPSLGLVIVLDRSGSMDGQKLALAKEAAARTVSLLRDKDTLGVIAFDDRPWDIVKTKPLTDRKKAEEKIRSISPGGGTEIYSSLQQAYASLENLSLKRKHIILLTDGQSATSGSYQTLVEDGHDKQITLSTVSIGEGADRGLLNDLSQWGKGRFYDVTDASVIPSILTRETVITTRTYIEDQPFYPRVASSEWATLFKDGVPQMNAYIATSLKGTARMEMESGKNDPVLATWRYGLGRSFAFTSDTSGKWTGDFARWQGWPAFLNELVTRSFPDLRSNPYSIDVKEENENTRLKLSSSEGDISPLEVTVLSEDGKMIPATTRIKAPGDYEVVFEEHLSPGLYNMNIAKSGEGGESTFQTGFSVPYSKEYSFKGGSQSLDTIVEKTGGRKTSSLKGAFRDLHEPSFTARSIQTILITAGFLLFFCEIFIRRFGVGPIMMVVDLIKPRRTSQEMKDETSIEQLGRKVNKERRNDERKGTDRPRTLEATKENRESVKKVKREKKTAEPVVNGDDARLKRLLEAKKRREK